MIQKKNTEILIPEIQKNELKNAETLMPSTNPEVKKPEFVIPTKTEVAPKPNGPIPKQT